MDSCVLKVRSHKNEEIRACKEDLMILVFPKLLFKNLNFIESLYFIFINFTTKKKVFRI